MAYAPYLDTSHASQLTGQHFHQAIISIEAHFMAKSLPNERANERTSELTNERTNNNKKANTHSCM